MKELKKQFNDAKVVYRKKLGNVNKKALKELEDAFIELDPLLKEKMAADLEAEKAAAELKTASKAPAALGPEVPSTVKPELEAKATSQAIRNFF